MKGITVSSRPLVLLLLLVVMAAASIREAYAYTFDEVLIACERAYRYQVQVEACIANVCGTYGCDN